MASVRKSLGISVASKYSNFAIQFVSSIVLARLLTPAEIGVFTVGIAVTGFAHVVRDFGVTNYLVQESELTDDRIRAALSLTCAVAWSMAGLLALIATPVAIFYKEPGVREVLFVLAGTFVILPLSSTIMAVLRREMRFGALFKINLSANLVQALSAIVLASFGFGYMSLAWASLIGIGTTALVALLHHCSLPHLLPGIREIRRVLSFGVISLTANILQQVQTSAPNLLVGRLVGFDAVGLLSRASGLTGIFGRLILRGIQPVALPALAERRRAGADLSEPCLTAMSYIAVLAWPFSLYLALTAEPLITFLFGDQWIPAAPLLQIIAFGGLFSCVRPVCEPALVACGRVDLKLRVGMLTVPLNVALVFLAAMHSLTAVVYALVFAAMIQAALTVIYTRTVISFSLRKLSAAAAHVLGVTVVTIMVTAFVVWLCDVGQASNLVLLTSSALAFALTWILVVVFSNHSIASELLRLRKHLNDSRKKRRSV